MDYQAMYPWAPENLLKETSIYTSSEQIVITWKANAPNSVSWVGKTILVLSYDMIPIAQYEWFLTFLGIILSWIWDRHFKIELDQCSIIKNSPKLVPKPKLIWKFHVLSNWTEQNGRKGKGTEQIAQKQNCTEQKTRNEEETMKNNKEAKEPKQNS